MTDSGSKLTPAHTATIRTIDRDPTYRLITLTLDDGATARLSYHQAAQLHFWLKPGQTIELTGILNEGILRIDALHFLDHPDPASPPWPVHPRARALFGLPPRRLPSRNDGTNLEYVILVPILFVVLLLILKYCQ